MNSVRLVLVVLVVGFTVPDVTGSSDDAFSEDINTCLFTAWTTASGNKNAVLSKAVECKSKKGSAVQLCYGNNPPVAQFAVCYNTNTLTPYFTGHIVKSFIQSSGRDGWRTDTGELAPNPQASVADYTKIKQEGLYKNFVAKNSEQFCSRGHLTPNSDFSSAEDRSMTMITTNIAPQWQPFNGLNWAALENAVQTYAQNNGRDVYVFTGVGGKARNELGNVIVLNDRVLAPRWFWKAVCDPVAKQSIVFVGENSINDISTTQVAGCDGIMQTKKKGVVYCHSLEEVEANGLYSDFKLPSFNENCKPSVRGTFMDKLLKNKKTGLK